MQVQRFVVHTSDFSSPALGFFEQLRWGGSNIARDTVESDDATVAGSDDRSGPQFFLQPSPCGLESGNCVRFGAARAYIFITLVCSRRADQSYAATGYEPSTGELQQFEGNTRKAFGRTMCNRSRLTALFRLRFWHCDLHLRRGNSKWKRST